MHKPVLLQKVTNFLGIKEDCLFIDATFGQGGHSLEIIRRGGRVLGIEWDEKQYKREKIKNKQILKTRRLILVNKNFSEIEKIAKKNNFFPVDGILFDLGLSMWQLTDGGRGFSFKKLNEPLDMRLSKKLKVRASDLVNSLEEIKLYEIFAKYSEEINSLRLAKAIVSARKIRKIEKVGDLIEIINDVVGANEKVYARIFQALRIAVNNDLENLKLALEGSLKILKKTGRILTISFHSIEDRLVKRFIKEHRLRLLTKKAIRAKNNLNFERSAVLRVIVLNNE